MLKTLLTGFALGALLMVSTTAHAGQAPDEILWIDVRSAQEYAAEHVDEAVNIPHTEIVERIGEVTDDKDASLYLYCRSGRRSGIAAAALEEAGFTNVSNIGGLQDAREKAGSPSN